MAVSINWKSFLAGVLIRIIIRTLLFWGPFYYPQTLGWIQKAHPTQGSVIYSIGIGILESRLGGV